MLSNKWAFSLTSLIVMLSLCLVASPALKLEEGQTLNFRTFQKGFEA